MAVSQYDPAQTALDEAEKADSAAGSDVQGHMLSQKQQAEYNDITQTEERLEEEEEHRYGSDEGGSLKDFKVVFSSIRDYKKYSWATPLLVAGEVAMELLIPTLMAVLIDRGIQGKNMGEVWKWGSLLIVVALISLTFGVGAGRTAAVASSGLAKNLRHDLFTKVQSFSFTNIDHFSTGSLVTRLTTDVTNVQNAYQMLIRIAFRAPLMIIFAWIFAFRISHSISFIFLVVAPLLGFILIAIGLTVHPIFVKVFHTYDRLNSDVEENLLGVRVVKSFTRENYEETKFKSVSQRIYNYFVKAELKLAWNMPVMQLAIYGTVLLLSWMAAHQIVASGNNEALGLTTGDLTSLFTYTLQILMALMMLSMIFIMVVISRASAGRIAAVLKEESTVTNPENPVPAVADGSISFNHVTFRYNKESEKPVLSDINLTIPSGSTLGIVGGTGSSKSSLVQLIPRLYDSSEGNVQVGGVDVKGYSLDTLRKEVAMVLQKNILFSGTIKENLKWGNPQASDEEVIHAAKLAQADEFIQGFPDKYDTYLEQGGSNVSGGQKQRLCIARALLKKPKILILDDSTSAVDTKTDALIRKAFATEIPDTTIIIIAQRLSSVENADKIIMMEGGSIAAQGSHEELMRTSDEYRSIYESQNQSGVIDDGE